MLVLSRKAGERIDIGDDITIEIRRVAGNRVTIALEAPRDVRILRSELRHAVEAFEEAEAAPAPVEPAGVYAVTHQRVPSPLATIDAGI